MPTSTVTYTEYNVEQFISKNSSWAYRTGMKRGCWSGVSCHDTLKEAKKAVSDFRLHSSHRDTTPTGVYRIVRSIVSTENEVLMTYYPCQGPGALK